MSIFLVIFNYMMVVQKTIVSVPSLYNMYVGGSLSRNAGVEEDPNVQVASISVSNLKILSYRVVRLGTNPVHMGQYRFDPMS